MKIVADDKIPYLKGVLEPYAEVVYRPGRAIAAADVADAEVLLVRTRTRCDAGLLAGSPVRLVATATIGTDHIDLAWCARHGVEVVSAPGCNAAGVLQWVAAVLATSFGASDPASVTVGVVGVGHVGSLVARYAQAWGFRVLCSDPPREQAERLGVAQGYVPLAQLAAESDLVTFHVPFTQQGTFATCGLGGADFFRALKPGALVLNASRGGVVDEEVWLAALAAGRCRAGVDTWAHEPAIDRNLLAAAQFATPHIAGYSLQGKANATAAVVRAVARRYGWPLTAWYPAQVQPVERQPIDWHALCGRIGDYFDIARQSAALKAEPERFEQFREEYAFREEFF